MMSLLHNQHALGIYVTIYVEKELNKVDMNTKAHGGGTLYKTNIYVQQGKSCILTKWTIYYNLLELGTYYIVSRMLAFLLDPSREVYEKKHQ